MTISNPAQRVKKQHYVPRFYLSNFIDHDGLIWTYDSVEGSHRSSSPEKTAFENNFYSRINDGGTYFDDIESLLSMLEAVAAPLFPKLIDGHQLTPSNKTDLALFFAAQFVRSPSQIKACADLFGQITQKTTQLNLKDRQTFEVEFDEFNAKNGIITHAKTRDKTWEMLNEPEKMKMSVDQSAGLMSFAALEKVADIFE